MSDYYGVVPVGVGSLTDKMGPAVRSTGTYTYCTVVVVMMFGRAPVS